MSQQLWKNLLSKKLLSNSIAPVALVIGLAATGCGAQGPDTESGSPAAANEAVTAPNAPQGSEDAALEQGHFRGRGPDMIFRAALSELDLTADQKTKINGLIDGMHPTADDHPAPTELFSSLADQVRANKIDEPALQAKIVALKPDPAASGHAKMAASLQTLHDTLTSDQRTKLVASIEAKMAAHESKEAARHEAHEGKGGHGAPFLHGVDLTDDQRTKIEQALASAGIDKEEGKERFTEMKAHIKTVLDAFPADKFDAAALMPQPADGPGSHMSKLVKAMTVVVPLLTDAQRAQLADNLQKGPMAHGPKGANHQAPAEAP